MLGDLLVELGEPDFSSVGHAVVIPSLQVTSSITGGVSRGLSSPCTIINEVHTC